MSLYEELRGMRDERRQKREKGRETKDENPAVVRVGGPPSSLVTVLLVLLVLTSSCGYHLSGTGAIVPEGSRSLSVLTFINGTNEPSVDIEVTRAVVNEFLADGRLRLVDTEEADLVLRGKVVKYDATALSYTSTDDPQNPFVQQYRVRMSVDASLEERSTGKVLWQDKSIDSNLISSYTVTFDTVPVIDPATGKPVTTPPLTQRELNIRDTKITKDAAIKKASQDIAWTIRSRILEGF